jgi:serine/threonine protein kinase
MYLNPSVTFQHPNLPDLKSNILVDNNGHACLAGPSLLTMPSDELSDMSPIEKRGTVRWMSPELLGAEKFGLQDGRPTKASDCYALGMVIYEVLSGQIPFTADTDLAVMVKTMKGERPGRPQGKEGKLFTNNIWDTLKLCWKERPRDRIDASAVLLRLENHPPLPIPSS